jgi:hypothetical protein
MTATPSVPPPMSGRSVVNTTDPFAEVRPPNQRERLVFLPDPDDAAAIRALADDFAICSLWHRDYEAGDPPCRTCSQITRRIVQRLISADWQAEIDG